MGQSDSLTVWQSDSPVKGGLGQSDRPIPWGQMNILKSNTNIGETEEFWLSFSYSMFQSEQSFEILPESVMTKSNKKV